MGSFRDDQNLSWQNDQDIVPHHRQFPTYGCKIVFLQLIETFLGSGMLVIKTKKKSTSIEMKRIPRP